MSHANAGFDFRALEQGWTYAAAATVLMVSTRTAKKWADRCRIEVPPGWSTAAHDMIR